MGEIVVKNIGKAYKAYPSKMSRLREWIIPFTKPRHTLHWVLQDITFTVQAGEAVGIIGVNGAGKSTLLKMLTGTTQPTTGSIDICGRVAALLELGMGFHPDFTGRQNAIMAGQLLGYSPEEIHHLMPEIEAFAGIDDYLDQPVRVYSSGMQMRLAFSVATATRPDVLIVDEALSVGDTFFQHKSFDRIRQFQKQGTTLLIVSHDKAAIQAICGRAILLSAGKIAMEGEPEAVMDYYNAMLGGDARQKVSITQTKLENGRVTTKSGSNMAYISDIAIVNHKLERIEFIEVGSVVSLKVEVSAKVDIPKLVVGYLIKNRFGQEMFGTNTALKKCNVNNVSPDELITYDFEFPMNLGVGNYSISIALTNSETHLEENFEWRDLALVFEVVNSNHGHFAGSVWLDPSIKIQRQTN